MKRLRWYDYIWINVFWLGLDIRNTAAGSIFMPYLVAGFVSGAVMNTALSAMRTAGLIIAMLVQPAMGLLSDRSTSRFGRRRPFIFVGVMLDLVFLTAMGLAASYWGLLCAQKGPVPSPLLVPGHESYDFDFPLLFLPVAENKVINAISNDDTDSGLYCLTDRGRKYVEIASQTFTSQELRNLGTFIS